MFKKINLEQGLFSMYYGDDFIKNPLPNEVKKSELSDRTRFVKKYSFDEKLKIVETTDLLKGYPVVESVLTVENGSDKTTKRIKDLKTVDLTFEFEKDTITGWACDRDYLKIIRYSGVETMESEFRPCNDYIKSNDVYSYAPIKGRSCDETMSYFDIVRKDAGIILAIGWTGQWQADFNRETDGLVRTRIGLQTCDFVLLKGETYRYASVSLYFYDNGFINGHNGFRKYMKSISPFGKDERPSRPPIAMGTWGGLSEDKHLRLIDYFSSLKAEVYWMDASWFGHMSKEEAEGGAGWTKQVGNWNVNKNVHPSEFSSIKESCEKNGIKPLLWFEFERALDCSDEYKKHPEWFLDRHDGDASCDQYMLNLAIPEVREYFFRLFADYVEKVGIKWFRMDFNMDALPYYRNNESVGRKGIIELAYINGLYSFLDMILERYPYMMIDNCASGGNRMDIEMQKRSVTLWRSDYNCNPTYLVEGLQAATMGSALLFPYQGCGVRASSESMYDARSSYGSAIDINTMDDNFVNAWKDAEKYDQKDLKVAFAKHLRPYLEKILSEYKQIRGLYSENFAAHSCFDADPYSWCCYEFYNDEKTESVVHVFRRRLSDLRVADYILDGVDERFDYIVQDMDGETYEISGKELKKNGLHVEINIKPESKLYYIVKK